MRTSTSESQRIVGAAAAAAAAAAGSKNYPPCIVHGHQANEGGTRAGDACRDNGDQRGGGDQLPVEAECIDGHNQGVTHIPAKRE